MTCLVIAVLSEATLIVGGARVTGFSGLVLVLLATAAWAFVVFDRGIEPRPAAVMIAIAAVFAVAVAMPPRGSHDLWSYVMSGRTVSVHHTNPYVHAPSAFAHDPFLAYVGRGWRHARSVYGPLFTGISAALTRLTGGSVLRTRLAFQGLAAASIAGALVLTWRETRSARALAFLGLHPAVVTAIVNGGHNDGLVGLAVLGGVLLAARRRWYGAGLVLGLGILCKASGVLGLAGIVAWAAHRDRRDRDPWGAAKLAATAFATVVAGYVPFGAVAARAVAGAEHGNTRASPWDVVRTLTHAPGAVATLTVFAFVAGAAWRARVSSRPGPAATAPMAAYLLGGAFVLPWYPAWALPVVALERRSFLGVLVAVHAAFLVAVYEFELPAHETLAGGLAVVRDVVIIGIAFGLLAAAVTGLARAETPEPRPGFPLRP